MVRDNGALTLISTLECQIRAGKQPEVEMTIYTLTKNRNVDERKDEYMYITLYRANAAGIVSVKVIREDGVVRLGV